MKNKNWAVWQLDIDCARKLGEECGFTPLAAVALCARGINTKEKADTFLSVDIAGLQDPWLMRDMDLAVREIREAIVKHENIVVFGDYDVDGVTATCVLTDYLRTQGASCTYYIPDRTNEGYGLNIAAIARLIDDGAQTLITVDSGITALEEIQYAVERGLRVIITDHHECHSILPPAAAVIDPRRTDCEYPFTELAGVGVAFKLVCALDGDEEQMLARYGELVALGTVADVMPIIGENRVIVEAGLRQMEHSRSLGLATLLQEAGQTDRRLTSGTISFVLAPRINAAGRLGQAGRAVELLMTEDAARAHTLALWLCEQNRCRQTSETGILSEAIAQLNKEYDPLEDKLIVLVGDNWHSGVIGIVASRLCERYSCPVVLISMEDDIGKGSARSMQGFNLFDAFCACGDLLEKYGGHALAAGLTIRRACITAFIERLKAYAQRVINPADMRPTLPITAILTPEWLCQASVEGIGVLEPFGPHNEQPVFAMEDLVVEDITPLSSDRHVRLTLSRGGVRYTALLFGTGVGGCGFAQGNMVDVAFYLEINSFRGKRTLQLTLQDIKLSKCELIADQKLLDIYARYMNDQPLLANEARALLPDRSDLVAVWRHIISRAEGSTLSVPSNALSRRIRWESRRDIEIGKVLVCLDVFSESRLLSYHFKDELIHVRLKEFEGKADISGSVVLHTLRGMSG